MPPQEKRPSTLQQTKSFPGEIAEVRIDKNNGHAYVKVMLSDGTLLGGKFQAEDTLIDIDLTKLDYKVLKLTPEAEAAMKVGLDSSELVGGVNNRITSTKKYGNFIVGPVTMTAHPESFRIGGVFRFNGLLTSTMPSTIITPISTLILDLPGKAMIASLKDSLSTYKQVLGV